MDLRDLQDRYHEVTEEKIVVGALILTVLSDEDGLVSKNDRTKKTQTFDYNWCRQTEATMLWFSPSKYQTKS